MVTAIVCLAASNLAAQSQTAMNQDNCAQYKQADQVLNTTYATVLKSYAQDAQVLAKFKQAQRAWIAFRDAQLEARFPKFNKQAEYGSAYPHLPLQPARRTNTAAQQRTKSVGRRNSGRRRLQWQRKDGARRHQTNRRPVESGSPGMHKAAPFVNVL
jgi:uncharacterized protein YecT (DUF1311 family)